MAAGARPLSASRRGRTPSPQMRPLAHEQPGTWTSMVCEAPRPPLPPSALATSPRGQLTAPVSDLSATCSPQPSRPPLRRSSPRRPSPSERSSRPPSPGLCLLPSPVLQRASRSPYAAHDSKGTLALGRPPRPSSESGCMETAICGSSTWDSSMFGRLKQHSLVSPQLGRPHSPRLRLEPLGAGTQSRNQRMPSPLARALQQEPAGRIGLLQSIRRSTPSPTCAALPPETAPWEKTAEVDIVLRTSVSEKKLLADSDVSYPRQSIPNVRIGHRRPSLDFGRTSPNRGRNLSEIVSPQGQRERCGSLPPTGTVKADEAAAAQGKARAIVVLKILFSQEIAKGGQDANSAAANAVRRLSQLPERVSIAMASEAGS